MNDRLGKAVRSTAGCNWSIASCLRLARSLVQHSFLCNIIYFAICNSLCVATEPALYASASFKGAIASSHDGNTDLTHFTKRLPIPAMFNSKAAIPLFLILALVFIGFGDQFLPQPMRSASFNTRVALDSWMTNSFTLWKPKTNPNARTERAIQQQESGKNP